MSPTALYLLLFALLLAGVAFGATLLNVPPLWTLAVVVLGAAAALLGVTAGPRRGK